MFYTERNYAAAPRVMVADLLQAFSLLRAVSEVVYSMSQSGQQVNAEQYYANKGDLQA